MQENRYSRHELLKEVGVEGQKRISQGRVLIIGAGGLGSPASLYLASSGVKKITIVDSDTVDLTNLQRQVIHNVERLGMNKAESAKVSLEAINPEVEIVPVDYRPTLEELEKLVSECDVALDCTDNTESRYIFNDVCRRFKKPLVTAGVVAFDGQITVFDFRDPESACYACLFPNHEGKDEKASTKGVFAPLVGILGCMQAAEALKIIGKFGEPLTGRLLMVDARTMTWCQMKYRRDDECPCCSQGR